MPVLYSNNAASTLGSSITNSATSLSVASGQGALFPEISGGNHFYVTLTDIAFNVEIMRVTARSADTLTVTRGQDGTTARSWSAGDAVQLRITRAMLDDVKTDARSALTSANVTLALGFTPYNSSNPSGYITSSALSSYLPLSGGTLTGDLVGPSLTIGGLGRSASSTIGANLGTAATNWNNAQLEIKNSDNGTVGVAFHRAGYTSNSISVTDTNGIRIDGNLALHAANYSSYALPLSGGTLTGDVITRGIRVPHNDHELSLGYNGTGNGVGVYFNSGADGVYFYNRTGGANSVFIGRSGGLNVTTGALTQGGNQVLHAANYSSYALPLSGGTVTGTISTAGLVPIGVGGNSNVSHDSYKFGYQESGSWDWPYPDLIIGYHTGIKFGANTGYGGMRFYADHPGSSSTVLFSIGDGDSNVRVANTLLVNGNTALHAGNYNSYSPTLTGGNASGTWGINTTGTVNGLTLGIGAGALVGNVAVGLLALSSNTTGNNNTSVGYQAGTNYNTGSNNISLGYQSAFNASGSINNSIAIGSSTLQNFTNGQNIAIGNQAYYSAAGYPASGASNIAIGYQAAGYSFYYHSGNENVFIGNTAGFFSNSGSQNLVAGASAGYNLNTGSSNTYLGHVAGYSAYGSAIGNVCVGRSAGYGFYNNSSYNVAIGAYALDASSSNMGFNVAVGVEAFGSNISSYGTAVGAYSLLQNTSGTGNAALGAYSGYSNTTGIQNTAIGRDALYNNVTGSNQTATGFQSMYYMRGGNNTATGVQAMYGSTTTASNTGSSNTANGYRSLYSLVNGTSNVAVGSQALFSNNTGANNTASGTMSAYSTTTGNNAVAVGYQALFGNSTANNQTAVGFQALCNLNGSENTALGYQALFGNNMSTSNSGYWNVAVGSLTMTNITTSSQNTAVGHSSLNTLTTGIDNVGLGYSSGSSITTGSSNVAVGSGALKGASSQSNLTAVGHQSMFLFGGSGNTATGYRALYGNSNAAFANTGTNNTANGYQSLFGVSSGSNNSAYGYLSAYSITTGNHNTAVGNQALYNISSGGYNTALGSTALSAAVNDSYGNTAVGYSSLGAVSAATFNVAVGMGAGTSLADGTFANALTTGSLNTYIGSHSYPSGPTVTREIVIGYSTTGKGSSTGFINPGGGGVYQGNNSSTWSQVSDARIKHNFTPVTNGLEVVNALDPIEFDYILTGKHDVGFTAQQYMGVLPAQVSKHIASGEEKELVGESEIYGIQRNLDPYLVSAIKALTYQVREIQAEVLQLKGL